MRKKRPLTKKSQLKAQKKYDKVNTKSYCMKLNMTTDKDIIERLQEKESVQGYIKELIRRDIENEK